MGWVVSAITLHNFSSDLDAEREARRHRSSFNQVVLEAIVDLNFIFRRRNSLTVVFSNEAFLFLDRVSVLWAGKSMVSWRVSLWSIPEAKSEMSEIQAYL